MRYPIKIKNELKKVDVYAALVRNEKNEPWVAMLADYEGGDPMGWGITPEDAIEDLKAEIEWRNEPA